MASTNESKSPTNLSLGRLISFLFMDMADLLPLLFQALRYLVNRSQQEGMYEILDYDSTLELLDSKGEWAVFRRRQKVKFLQDNVIAFQDHAWGDGDIFAKYAVSPGKEVDCYQDGNRWNVLISLRETKNRGDVEEFYIDRTVHNGFTRHEEWRQIYIEYKTHRLRLAVIFPAERHCRRAVLIKRNKNETIELDQTHFNTLPDGRQELAWETQRPRHYETYTLKWAW